LVYGGIFTLDDYDFHINSLDGYHICSKSTLLLNHKQDLHHRHQVDVVPISFQSLDDLSRLKYKEREPVVVQCYLGNQQHKHIKNRLVSTPISYRILDGIHVAKFRELYEENENVRY
jgi:hypothetical protein